MSGIGTVKWDINIFFDHINSTVHGMIVMFIFTMTQLVRVTCVWADIGNEPEPSWLSLVDNESKLSNFFSSAERKIRNTPLVGLNTFSMCWLIICAGIFFTLIFYNFVLFIIKQLSKFAKPWNTRYVLFLILKHDLFHKNTALF